MKGREWFVGVPFVAMVVGLTAALSGPRLEPDRAGAVVVAIEEHYSDLFKVLPIGSPATSKYGFLILCLDTNRQVNIQEVAVKFARTNLTVISSDRCHTNETPVPKGRYSSHADYFDEKDRSADHLRIAKLQCLSSRKCVIEIDSYAWGHRFHTVQADGTWVIASYEPGWMF